MQMPNVVSRADWQAARDELLAEEKAATSAADALAAKRRRLPMVRIGHPQDPPYSWWRRHDEY